MRKINTYKYANKTFRAGDLTVGWWMWFIEDPEGFFVEYLSEYNEKPPKLSAEYQRAFIEAIVGTDIKNDTKSGHEQVQDLHIIIGKMMVAVPGLSYQDILSMPLAFFEKFLKDIEYITGQKEYQKGSGDASQSISALKNFKNMG